jgi:SAM-dependent methyltransferase
LPRTWHHVERYANNRVEADHAQLKRRLRPMRGIKTISGLRVLAAGHAFVQNLRRGHYETAVDQPRNLRLAATFRELATAIGGASPDSRRSRPAPRSANATDPVGAGPGFLVAEMAEQVGPNGHVAGLDISDSMVVLAQRRWAEEPVQSRTTIIEADATALPFSAASFDAAVSTQVYEYVPDVAQALAELHRVLRPGGRALILDTDWNSVVWNARDRRRMQRILAAWNERFADPYLPRTLARRLRDAGFEIHSRDVLVLFNPEYDPDTYSVSNGRIMADFVMGRQAVTRDEVEAWRHDLEQRDREGDYFFSLNRYLFLAEKRGSRVAR